MLVAADWVVPMDGPPIKDGAVLVGGATVDAVGPAGTLAARNPKAHRHDHPGCIIAPGLINAHTHLSLSALSGLVESAPFHQWLDAIVPAIKALTADEIAASVAYGAAECIEHGITSVGDICYGPEAPAAAADEGVHGVFFWEINGVSPSEMAQVLAEREFPIDPRHACRRRTQCGLSPHAIYTSGPELLRGTHRFAADAGVAFALHVAESTAETELTLTGSGPLETVARKLAWGFRTPKTGPTRYLDRLGVLEGAIAVHCVYLEPGDARLLAQKTRGVVLCPRSNRYLRVGPAPAAEIVRAGARVALGTDSMASNGDLDLFEEARTLRKLDGSLTADRLLRMLTCDAAEVLGISGICGSLTPGKHADLVVVETGPTDDPYAALIEMGRRSTVRSVVSSGTWRVIDGRTTAPSRSRRHVAESIARRVSAAVGRHQPRHS